MLKRMFFVTALVLGLLSVSFAQENNAKKFAGVWVGTMDMGGQTMTVIFKFQEKDGKLSGTGESPEQGGGAIALDNITVTGNKIQFEITPIQGGFDGIYKEDTKKIDGTLVVNQQGIPLLLTKDEKAAAAAKEEKKYDSIWEGSIAAGMGSTLRVVIKIYKNADGTLGAFLNSPDQGDKDMPIDSVTLTEDTLKFELAAIKASYEGKIDKASMTSNGTLKQAGMDMTLNLKKADKPAVK